MREKISDRIKAMQDKAASMVAPEPELAVEVEEQTVEEALAAASVHFGGAVDQLIQNRTIQRLPVTQIAPDTRPEMRQARMLPLPHQLMLGDEPAPQYRDLLAELQGLGASLRERQIQPIVVYPGTSAALTGAKYLILVGQRRWTAAALAGLDTLDAVVIDPPSPAERVFIQYAENEAREEFSDMERAWSLQQMKQALGDAPWETVEAQLHMSRARRQQLLRMLAFTPEQQQRVAILRLQETQARPLHSAVREGALGAEQIDGILERLGRIAVERYASHAQQAQTETATSGVSPRRLGIDAPTVARLVAKAGRAAHAQPERTPAPRWLAPLEAQLKATTQGLQRSSERIEALGAAEAARLRQELQRLQSQLEAVLGRLAA
jgi:ParB/RepB/Spo0J family partition protein